MSKNLNQDDVLGVGDEPPQGVFAADPNEEPNKAKKPAAVAKDGKAKKGLSTTAYFFIGMIVLLVAMVWWKMPRNNKSAGEVDQMTGSSMSLEQAPDEPRQSPSVPMPSENHSYPSEQAAQTATAPAPQLGAPAESLAVSKTTEPLTPATHSTSVAAINTDAADLAVGPAMQAQLPVQQSAPEIVATAAPTPSQTTAAPSAEMEKVRRDLDVLSGKVDQLLARDEGRRNTAATDTKPASKTAQSKLAAKRVSPQAAARQVAKAEPASKSEPIAITGVSLRAVVGESAWVMTSQGESKQVTVGDVVPGAGVVKSVNAEAGTVNLVDGRVLR